MQDLKALERGSLEDLGIVGTISPERLRLGCGGGLC